MLREGKGGVSAPLLGKGSRWFSFKRPYRIVCLLSVGGKGGEKGILPRRTVRRRDWALDRGKGHVPPLRKSTSTTRSEKNGASVVEGKRIHQENEALERHYQEKERTSESEKTPLREVDEELAMDVSSGARGEREAFKKRELHLSRVSKGERLITRT